MSFKAVVVFCAQALLIQSISCQCIGALNGLAAPYAAPFAAAPLASPFAAAPCAAGAYGAAPFAAAPCGVVSYGAAPFAAEYAGYSAAAVPASNGGGLAISSASPILPSGVSVLSENAIEGALAVGGQLPFLGTVALEGALPTAGAGAVTYGCGNGNVAILAEEAGAAGYNTLAGSLGYGAGLAGYGYGPAAYGPAGLGAATYGPAAYGPAGCGCGAIY